MQGCGGMMQQMNQMSQMMMNPMMMGGGMGDMNEMMKKMTEMMGGGGKKTKEEKTAAKQKKSKDNANVVFVGGLRKTTEEDRVAAHFAKFGQVEHVDIKRLPDGTSRGFAFIKFADTEAVDKVIEAHAKHMIDNKWVEVKKHDGIAASAGMEASIKKKDDDEPEQQEEDREDWSEKWSEKYLAMASKLGEAESGESKKPKASGGDDQMAQMMQSMGMDASMMKQMGFDASSMKKMMKSMGLDPKMMSAMGMDPNQMMMSMMGGMGGMGGMMGGMGGMMGGMSGMKGMGMDPSMMKMMGMSEGKKKSKDSQPSLPDQPPPPSDRRSRSRSGRRSPEPSREPPPMRPQEGADFFVPGASSGGDKPGATLTGMLGSKPAAPQPSPGLFRPAPPQAPPEDPAQVAARKAAASAAAAAFAMAAGRVAETSRDAARDAATAKAAAAPIMQEERRPMGFESGDRVADSGMKPVKLWLPEPTVQEQTQPRYRDTRDSDPPPPRRDSPRRPRSRSRSNKRNRGRKSGGWDNEEAQPQPGSFTAQAAPSRPALPPGASAAPLSLPGPSPSSVMSGMTGASQRASAAPVNRFGIPEATPEALAAAVFRAQQVEQAGLDAIRSTGQIPRGPPDLPTGTEVIEQKCVAYLIGKGGQALAAINAAAGVSIQIDQSTKSFGWSMANIYGTEEGAAKAKMILRQKVSEYRPLRA